MAQVHQASQMAAGADSDSLAAILVTTICGDTDHASCTSIGFLLQGRLEGILERGDWVVDEGPTLRWGIAPVSLMADDCRGAECPARAAPSHRVLRGCLSVACARLRRAPSGGERVHQLRGSGQVSKCR